MTQYILRLKLTVCLLVSSVCIHALPSIESLRDELRYKTTSSDSLELLFDIYDLTSYDKREPILEELFATATRANSEQACLDALSLMAGAYEDNDSLQAILLKRIASMPATDEQKSTMLYIKVRDASRKIRSMSEKERQEKAEEKKHMTFLEAAHIAREAGVEEMWLTHYSPSLLHPEDYMKPVRKIFPQAFPGKDRKSCTLEFPED